MGIVTGWQLQLEKITALQSQQHYGEAEGLCTELLQKLPPPPASLVIQVKIQSLLIDCLEAQARYLEAQALIEPAQTALQEIKATYPIQILLALELKVLAQKATLARIQGRYAEAEAVFQQAIHLATEHGLRHQPFWRKLLNDCAIVYKYWGRFDAAEDLYQTVLADLIEQHGEHHIKVATVYHNLAGLYHARRLYAEAAPYARKSYQLHVDLLGSQHSQTIADGAALGSILHGLEQWDDAIAHFETAIAFFEQQFGPVHYEVAINLNNLAASLQAKGELEPAEKAYRRALEIKEILLGTHHPDVAISLNNLASLLQKKDDLGDLIEVKAIFERAIAIFEMTVGLDHPNTQLCRENASKHLAKCVS
ncbi:MAG: tetratricopeptide repeat protein [Cyanobacteria bacterium J06639_14]